MAGHLGAKSRCCQVANRRRLRLARCLRQSPFARNRRRRMNRAAAMVERGAAARRRESEWRCAPALSPPSVGTRGPTGRGGTVGSRARSATTARIGGRPIPPTLPGGAAPTSHSGDGAASAFIGALFPLGRPASATSNRRCAAVASRLVAIGRVSGNGAAAPLDRGRSGGPGSAAFVSTRRAPRRAAADGCRESRAVRYPAGSAA